jgi:hypothetical protein
MMMQEQSTTHTYGTAAGRTRYLAFNGTDRQGRLQAGPGRTRGSRQRQGLRPLVGVSPQSYMLKQRQPDGE